MNRDTRPIAILGAGFAGLTAADYLRRHHIPFIVFEAGKNVAGLARSECDSDGFTYDCGAHFITNRLAAAVGVSARCRPMPKYGESVWIRGRALSYPTGLLRSIRYVTSAIASRCRGLFRRPDRSATDHYRHAYGQRLADEVAIPLTEAWSGCPADELAASVGKKFATSLPRTLVLKSAAWITKRTVAVGYSSTIPESPHVWHVYPEGGIGAVCEHLAAPIADSIRTQSPIERIEVRQGRVEEVLVGGEKIPVRAVISTALVTVLSKLVNGSDRLQYLNRFRYRAMAFVNLKLSGPSNLPDVVTWTPESSSPFFRLSDIGQGLPWLVPAGKSQVTCDIGCQIGDETWKTSDDELTERCLNGLATMVPNVRSRYLGSRVVRTGLAYPIYRSEYENDRLRFERGTEIDGLISVGRNGEFSHSLMEDVYWRTRWKVGQLINSPN